jgi:hypothetical protein
VNTGDFRTRKRPLKSRSVPITSPGVNASDFGFPRTHVKSVWPSAITSVPCCSEVITTSSAETGATVDASRIPAASKAVTRPMPERRRLVPLVDELIADL